MTHVICFSKGHSSAVVAIEVFRRYGRESLVLLNHDINPNVEHEDIKRFGSEVAAYVGAPITYANAWGIEDPAGIPDQFDVCVKAKAFQTPDRHPLCTSRLKTRPFQEWLGRNHPEKDCIVYYGFDEDEQDRISRRRRIMDAMGYRTEYPLAEWEPTITSTEEVGIRPPLTYSVWKHANCVGCLRASEQHWYAVYCLRPDIWKKAKAAEQTIGHHIIKGKFLSSVENKFEAMKNAGIEPTEKIHHATFWARARKIVGARPLEGVERLPCECAT